MRSILALLASLLLALPACAQEAEPSVLIAYFTWAENTVIEDEAASLAARWRIMTTWATARAAWTRLPPPAC